MIPHDRAAYQLFHEGQIALAQMEAEGFRVDVKKLHSSIKRTEGQIAEQIKALSDHEVRKVWHDRFRGKTNYDSNVQLGTILFDVLKLPAPAEKTKTGQYKTDEKTLKRVNHPYIHAYFGIKKRNKGLDFLKGIRKHLIGDRIHTSYNLAGKPGDKKGGDPRTYRSSSSDPNTQQWPSRDEEMYHLVRDVIIPTPGCQLIEDDFKQVEVSVGYCYHKDPKMKLYLEDPNTDMHRDAAMRLFKLPADQINKKIRHLAKNGFVFPEFYGAYWLKCAGAIWNDASGVHIGADEKGPLLLKHLRSIGIKKLGHQDETNNTPMPHSFEEHVSSVEQAFWNEDFAVYTQWKKDHYQRYLKRGWFKTLTGFICQGYMRRNQVINYPVQGSAFHCLLWALIQMQREMRKAKMKSKLIGQIHDSLIGNVHPKEAQDFIALSQEIMAKRILKVWPWIITPLKVSIEVAPVDAPWTEKKEWKEAA